ncbi:glycoside hydrolase family 1 protein [Cryobacterium sp. TMB1-7]|uniref:glycoside hydrolase family 1 protein n=1 Tax=Cryobacterium sp. TMB1-7 TaxID=2555866 RepID=UPI00106B8755|nr:family 1 glycosylhydrolase [Cryobacterium sp. TMB1-7]TFC61128.1 glycosyl hydrolase family protein [Cryobacterium sp. TMB1-7]
MLHFPEGFRWGSATAAHQIEGNNVSSDWWRREHLVDSTIAEPSLDACDSYHRFREDMQALVDAGLGIYRFSIEWARIEPQKGFVSQAELAHYRRMVLTAIELGLEPMITLHHFTIPQWFEDEGGWRAPDAVERFAFYTRTVLPVLEGVEWVCTINEPNMVAMMAGGDGLGTTLQAFGQPGPDVSVARTLLAAHRACRAVLAEAGDFRTGWTVATQDFQPEPGCEEIAREYGYDRDAWYLEMAAGDDWVGVQAYTRTKIGPEGPLPIADDAERTLTGWEFYPRALEDGIRLSHEMAPGVPVFVTENGIATDDDTRRVAYLQGALEGLHRAITDGIQVEGYLYWSLLDNYEWGSYGPTFGLVSVDRSTFVRTVKPSAHWLGNVATANALAV